MSRRESHFSWCDVLLVITLVLVGCAAYLLLKTEPEVDAAKQESEELRIIFKECQDLARQGMLNPERTRRESDLRWQETLLLENQYLKIADRLKTDVPELKKTLDQIGQQKVTTDPSQPDLKIWIQRQREWPRFEELESRSKELKERLAAEPLTGTNGPIQLTEDINSLLGETERAYQRYQADFRAIIENSHKPLVSGMVATHRDSARQALVRLSDLGHQARRDALAIGTLLDIEPRTETAKLSQRQQEVAQAFLAAGSPEEFMRRVGAGSKSGGGVADQRDLGLRRVWYLMIGILVMLGAYIIIELYRRTVVSPLHSKLVEQDGQIQSQTKIAHLEELAAGLAHEIRNPLTTISARLYTVQRKLRDGTPEHEDTQVITSEIDRINQILKEFIQITKPAPPKMELIAAQPLLEDISHLMTPQLERQAVKLEVQSPSRARFYGDQQQLKQVLINLVQNAAESMDRDGDGEVILRAREDKLPFKGSVSPVAIIEVEDNGPGIRPEVQSRLFEPFFSTKKDGTGLGLPISARIIDRHGGTLDFETQPERGTIFRIMLPGYEKR